MTDTSLLVLKDLSDLLGYERTAARPVLLAVAARLTYLSSLLTLGSVSGVLRESHAGLLLHELDTIKGEISEYIASDDRCPLRARMKDRQREGLGERDERDTQPAPHGSVVVPNAVSRTERIKDIIRTKGQVSIKDISEVIKDVSEKSIQRDLNDLIDSGQVVRKGERRWSVYLLNNIPDA